MCTIFFTCLLFFAALCLTILAKKNKNVGIIDLLETLFREFFRESLESSFSLFIFYLDACDVSFYESSLNFFLAA